MGGTLGLAKEEPVGLPQDDSGALVVALPQTRYQVSQFLKIIDFNIDII